MLCSYQVHRSNRLLDRLARNLIATEGWLKQVEIASVIHCTPSCLNAWLRGRNELKQVEVLLKLMDFLPADVWRAALEEAVKPAPLPRRSVRASGGRKKKKRSRSSVRLHLN